MDKLGLIEIFLEVVSTGNFVGAATSLGVSPSTVSKAVARLESHLGFQLFVRTTRQLRLTLEGKIYADTSRGMLQTLQECETQLKSESLHPRGTLVINAPVSYGRLYLLPLLREFRNAYPDLDVALNLDDRYVDIIESGVDLCIRSGQLGESSLIGRQLSPIYFIICAAPAYIEKMGVPCDSSEFDRHAWIRFRFQQTGRLMPIRVVGDDGAEQLVDTGRNYIVDDGEALATLCAEGLGITQLPHFIAREWLMRGEIVALYPAIRPVGFGVFAVYANQEKTPAKITAFINFLQEHLASQGESAFKTWVETIRPIQQGDQNMQPRFDPPAARGQLSPDI